MEISTIKVNTEYTSDYTTAIKWLKEVGNKKLIACDFEAAIKYSPQQLQVLKGIVESSRHSFLEKKAAESVLQATALDHPAHIKITHFSVAWSDSDSYVIIMDSEEVTKAVLDFIITTDVKQVWHGASYDFRLVYYATGMFPKNYEDSQIFAKTIFNHVETYKARVGLKELAGNAYGAWGVTEDNFFTLENMYDPRMLKYAGIDSCATFWVWDRLVSTFQDADIQYPDTTENYSPWVQLPAPSPKTARYPEAHFYHNTAKWLVRDTVRIMMNGLPIDLHRVRELEKTLEVVLKEVEEAVGGNPTVQRFLKHRYHKMLETYIKLQHTKKKTPDDFRKEFNSKNAVHRCFFMDTFADKIGLNKPEETLPQGCSKWSVKLIRNFVGKYPPLKNLLDHKIAPSNPTAVEAMDRMADAATLRYNVRYDELIKEPKIDYPSFNPGSAKQKQEIFAWLGYSSDKTSPTTGADSWDRDQIVQLNQTATDQDVIDLTQTLIDHSFAAIVKNTFVKAFYNYTLEGVLYGQYVLLGAKSGRYTSKEPNMLNTPSSRSKFSKPVKSCFIAPKGFVVGAIDYAALEDRVLANLSEDINKMGIFLDDIDSHSLSAIYYWPDKAKEILKGLVSLDDKKEAAKVLKALCDEYNQDAETLRNRGKAISFGLAYGCFPPKVASAARMPLTEAEDVFNAYHHEMYPGITAYREGYVLESARAQGYVHLGLGFRMYTDSPDRDIRTLNNGTCQFWSILTALAINRIHQLIDEAGLENDIFVTSTIYDSIYFAIRDDSKYVKWLNDNLIPVMEQDFMEGQVIHNSVDLEIGPDWSTLHTLPHNASEDLIQKVRQKWP